MRDQLVDFLNNRRTATLAIAAAFALSLVAARPSFQTFKRWRASNLLAESEQLLEEEAFQDSFLKAHAAVLLDRDNIEASRHLAKLALWFNHPQAQRFWQTVLKHPDSQTEDWKNAIDACFAQRDCETAFQHLLAWENSGVLSHEEFELRRVQAYALSDNYQLALEFSSKAIEAIPQSSKLSNQYLEVVAVAAPLEFQINIAKKVLGEPSNNYKLEWIAKNAALPIELRFTALEHLLNDPKTSIQRQLAYLNYASTLGWERAAPRARALASRITLNDTSSLEALTTLLCSIGDYSHVLERLNSENANHNHILLRNLLIAQINQGNIDNAFELTSQQRTERLTSLAEETLLRALAFEKAGDISKFRNNLSEAASSATIDDLAFLEQQFKRLGESRPLLELYRRASDSPKYGPEARYLWMELAASLNQEGEIKSALSSESNWISQLKDPAQKANALYYSLIYNVGVKSSLTNAQELLATFSSNSHFRDLLGLAYMRNSNLPLARELVSLAPNIQLAKPSRHTIIAAAIYGRTLPDNEQFLDGERDLLKL